MRAALLAEARAVARTAFLFGRGPHDLAVAVVGEADDNRHRSYIGRHKGGCEQSSGIATEWHRNCTRRYGVTPKVQPTSKGPNGSSVEIPESVDEEVVS